MSLSGWRPADTTMSSSTKRDPAPGPRFTSSTPAPAGMSSTSMATSPEGSATSSAGMSVMVCSSPRTSRGAPHDEQKLLLPGLRWPHWLQKTSANALSLDEGAIGGGVEQLVELRHVGHGDHADPAFAVRIIVEPLRRIAEV